MHTFSTILAAAFLGGLNPPVALGCESAYSTSSQQAWLPCVRVADEGAVFAVTMEQISELDFEVVDATRLNLADAQVADVRVTTDPIPVLLAYVLLPDSCTEIYEPAQVRIDNQTHRITAQVKVILPRPDQVCLTVVRTGVKAFALDPLALEPGGTTYTVEVNGFSREFFFTPSLP
jgi:hypothetical protein